MLVDNYSGKISLLVSLLKQIFENFRQEIRPNPGLPDRRPGASGNNYDDRPITPLRASYKQIAEQTGEEELDRNPTRETSERSLKNTRTMSASQRATMNSMSRTIGPRHPGNHQQQQEPIPMSLSRTIGSASKQRPPIDDGLFEEFVRRE